MVSDKRLRTVQHVLGACATVGVSFARMLHTRFIAEDLPTKSWSVVRAPHDDSVISRGFDSRTQRKRPEQP